MNPKISTITQNNTAKNFEVFFEKILQMGFEHGPAAKFCSMTKNSWAAKSSVAKKLLSHFIFPDPMKEPKNHSLSYQCCSFSLCRNY
jgi:hypothetical protein